MDRPLFQAAEVLDMAIEIERQGLAFYRSCGIARASEQVAEVFEYAAEQERRHIELFAQMKADLDQYTVPESYAGENLAYVRTFVGERVFDDVDAATCAAEAIEDEFEAIDMALELERRSIGFYTGLREVVRESEQETIDEIVAEEHRHIRRLLRLRHELEQDDGDAPGR
ncbi:MAG: ferritin family protein [Armatimonadota bacterium]